VMLIRDALARRHRALVWAALVGWLVFACLLGIDLLGVWDVPAWLPSVLIVVVIVVQVRQSSPRSPVCGTHRRISILTDALPADRPGR